LAVTLAGRTLPNLTRLRLPASEAGDCSVEIKITSKIRIKRWGVSGLVSVESLVGGNLVLDATRCVELLEDRD
uniref:hypothetical protein n=1 Tax=Novipirellula sp. TaxID=2795430 RepID=UPI00356765CA